MLNEFCRCVTEAKPKWFLLENVPTVPNIAVDGYTIQRFDLNARECGMAQMRLRHFQFGSRDGLVIVPARVKPHGAASRICLATEGERPDRRDFSDFCEAQGLPRDFALPGMGIAAKYRAVGNGVPVPMARVIARAIRAANTRAADVRLCLCGCGRIVEGKQIAAGPACRKRLERRRRDQPAVTIPDVDTAG